VIADGLVLIAIAGEENVKKYKSEYSLLTFSSEHQFISKSSI
jgi:hypothetical protein